MDATWNNTKKLLNCLFKEPDTPIISEGATS